MKHKINMKEGVNMNNNLSFLRKNEAKTQKEISESLGISRSFYGLIEQGERKPTLILSKKIADYFGKNIEDIFFNNYCNEMKQKKKTS